MASCTEWCDRSQIFRFNFLFKPSIPAIMKKFVMWKDIVDQKVKKLQWSFLFYYKLQNSFGFVGDILKKKLEYKKWQKTIVWQWVQYGWYLYKGLSSILQEYKFSYFVLRVAHYLNLVEAHAVELSFKAQTFFGKLNYLPAGMVE